MLVCDGDLESRCLDMVLGADNQPLFNICDAVKGTCELSAAVAKTKYGDNLFFMPAPAFYPEALQTTPTDEIFNEASLKNLSERLLQIMNMLFLTFRLVPTGFTGRLCRFLKQL